MNKSFNSRKFITSEFDLESLRSDDSQFGSSDYADLTHESNQPAFEKEFYKNTRENTAEMVTMPTKRTNLSNSEIDTRSLTEKYSNKNTIYRPKMASVNSQNVLNNITEKIGNNREITENDFVGASITQWQRKPFEEIPEVIEEASSVNITPRRLEEENEEILKLAEEQRNVSPLFGGNKQQLNIFEEEKAIFLDTNVVTKFNIDREIELPNDVEMDVSILSSFENSEGGDILNSNEL